jgi:hypothetical protein
VRLVHVDGEPVANSADRFQAIGLGTERLAQRRNMNLEGVLFDDHAGPDGTQELVLGDDLALALGKNRQDVQSALAERNAHAGEQLALRLQRSRSKPNFVQGDVPCAAQSAEYHNSPESKQSFSLPTAFRKASAKLHRSAKEPEFRRP